MPRIFVALPLPDDVALTLSRALPALPGMRVVTPELLHFTLAFVGQVPEEGVAAVMSAAEAGAHGTAPFDVRFVRAGRFPDRGRPTVVWAAGDGPHAEMERLAASVRAELARRRAPFDPKPFRAHVTLARVADRATPEQCGAIDAAVRAVRFDGGPSFRSEAIRVVESRLTPTGPRYSARREIPLTGPPGGSRVPPGGSAERRGDDVG